MYQNYLFQVKMLAPCEKYVKKGFLYVIMDNVYQTVLSSQLNKASEPPGIPYKHYLKEVQMTSAKKT